MYLIEIYPKVIQPKHELTSGFTFSFIHGKTDKTGPKRGDKVFLLSPPCQPFLGLPSDCFYLQSVPEKQSNVRTQTRSQVNKGSQEPDSLLAVMCKVCICAGKSRRSSPAGSSGTQGVSA